MKTSRMFGRPKSPGGGSVVGHLPKRPGRTVGTSEAAWRIASEFVLVLDPERLMAAAKNPNAREKGRG